MKDLFEKKAFLVVAGAVAGLVGRQFLTSKTARKLAVNSMAGSMKLKEEATASYESIKEDAKDLKEEARRQAKA